MARWPLFPGFGNAGALSRSRLVRQCLSVAVLGVGSQGGVRTCATEGEVRGLATIWQQAGESGAGRRGERRVRAPGGTARSRACSGDLARLGIRRSPPVQGRRRRLGPSRELVNGAEPAPGEIPSATPCSCERRGPGARARRLAGAHKPQYRRLASRAQPRGSGGVGCWERRPAPKRSRWLRIHRFVAKNERHFVCQSRSLLHCS